MNSRLSSLKFINFAKSINFYQNRGTSIFNRPKRFYKSVTVTKDTEDENKFIVFLDKRKVKTLGQNVLKLPTEPLAEAIAHEFDSQLETLNMTNMRLTGLAFTAMDNPFHQTKENIIDSIMEYAPTDTVLYVSTEPEKLYNKEKEYWLPVIDWVNKKFSVDFKPTETLFDLPEISPKTDGNLREYFNNFNFWQLTGYQYSVEALKSILLSVAATENAINIEKAVEASRVEQIYQSHVWGNVEWCHDIEEMELACRLAAGKLFVNLSKGASQ
uniref:ATP synthase mitochondrial F1 complex assembly factor 2 n=1 Tax=Strongyloides papillosus TaxID=174720 RepID=A0A0N5B9B7_STREA